MIPSVLSPTSGYVQRSISSGSCRWCPWRRVKGGDLRTLVPSTLKNLAIICVVFSVQGYGKRVNCTTPRGQRVVVASMCRISVSIVFRLGATKGVKSNGLTTGIFGRVLFDCLPTCKLNYVFSSGLLLGGQCSSTLRWSSGRCRRSSCRSRRGCCRQKAG